MSCQPSVLARSVGVLTLLTYAVSKLTKTQVKVRVVLLVVQADTQSEIQRYLAFRAVFTVCFQNRPIEGNITFFYLMTVRKNQQTL